MGNIDPFQYLISTVFDLYLMVVVLRMWLQWARADFYNPLSQFVVKATQPLLSPMRRVIPAIGRLDTAALVLAFAVMLAKYLVLTLFGFTDFFSIPVTFWLMLLPLSLLKTIGKMLFWFLIIRAIMSWFSQGRNPFEMVLAQLTEPLVRPIRRILPSLGGLDFSFVVVLLGLNFTNLLLTKYLGMLWLIA